MRQRLERHYREHHLSDYSHYRSPIFERRALYQQAARFLEMLLFGSFETTCTGASHFAVSKPEFPETSRLAPIMLSRRARGKAIDRLIIDYGHIHRQSIADKDKAAKKALTETFQNWVAHFCRHIIGTTAPSGSIGFSSIRSVARRLKQPLADSLLGIECVEASELGLRFSNEDLVCNSESKSKK